MRLEHLTFTRFIAALTVVFFHYGSNIPPFNIAPFDQVFQAGPIAVSYFYALSGFIMAIAYYRPSTPENFNKWKYWLARFARIYPVYLIALLLIFAANFKTLDNATSALILNLTMLQAWVPAYPLSLNSPGWSLSVEAFFYLTFPLLLLIIYRGGLKALFTFSLILWVATQVFHAYLLNSSAYIPHNALHDFIYYNPLMHINTFILGLLVGIYYQNKQLNKIPPSYNGILLFLVLVVIAVLLIIRPHITPWFGYTVDYTNGLIAPLFLLSIVLLARERGRIKKIFTYSWFVLLGEASYSLYILQRPVYGLYNKYIATQIDTSELWHFYFYLVFLITISIISYKLFETPLRHWINTWYRSDTKYSTST